MADLQLKRLEAERDRLQAEFKTLNEAISTREACEECVWASHVTCRSNAATATTPSSCSHVQRRGAYVGAHSRRPSPTRLSAASRHRGRARKPSAHPPPQPLPSSSTTVSQSHQGRREGAGPVQPGRPAAGQPVDCVQRGWKRVLRRHMTSRLRELANVTPEFGAARRPHCRLAAEHAPCTSRGTPLLLAAWAGLLERSATRSVVACPAAVVAFASPGCQPHIVYCCLWRLRDGTRTRVRCEHPCGLIPQCDHRRRRRAHARHVRSRV